MTTEVTLDGAYLRFFMHQSARHEGLPVSQWLLELAKKHRLGGGSVFRAIAGYGRHGVLRHEAFFELADDLPVKVEFLLRDSEADALLQLVRDAGVELVYARTPAHLGILSKE